MSLLSLDPEGRALILVVDDEAPARVTLKAVLEEWYDVETAEDAEQAERMMVNMLPHILLTDYELPGRSGLELVSLVFEKYPQVVPVLLTGHTNKQEVRMADKKGNVFSVLGKPYDPTALLQTVRRAVTTAKLRALQNRVHAAQVRSGRK